MRIKLDNPSKALTVVSSTSNKYLVSTNKVGVIMISFFQIKELIIQNCNVMHILQELTSMQHLL